MAQTTPESKLLSDSTGQEVKEQVLESVGGEVGAAGAKHVDNSSPSTPSVAVSDLHSEKSSSQNSTNAQSNASSSRPSLVPLGSGNVQTSLITPVAPHPKRFSAVNINKKFLEKNTASGTATSSSSSSNAKSGSPATRPPVQPTSSHSRLVTAKLTASPAVASTAAGWSRPSSVAPSPATNSPNSTSPMPIAPVSQPSATAAPQLPHAGKVILPQPRNAVPQMSSSQKDSGANKPVWGNVKPPVVRPDLEPSDFPTAAEVANVASTLRKQTKAAEEAKTTSDNAAKLLRSEEADAFRGVHLDPDVHHWDEMEEDDDNFLGGVIEFGDGRQYKIESSESNQPGTLPTGNLPRSQADESKESTIPVSKEDRFVDDFDRSWPKSRNSPASAPKDVPLSAAPHTASPSVSPVISQATHSPQDSSRVLFNERSNRLEPYNQTHRQQPGSFGAKRSHYPEGPGSTQEPKSSRDAHNIQVLQKPVGGDFNSRGRRFSGSNGNYVPGPPNGFVGDRNRDREQFPRRDGPPPSPRLPRDHHAPLSVDTGSRDLNNDRGKRGNMGPPPVPLHAAQKFSQEGGRQLPPHLSQVSPNIPSRRLPSRDSRFSPAESPVGLPASASGRIPPHSPAISHASLNVVSPVVPPSANLPTLSAPELDEVRKDMMHTAAERAKQRRQQEEEEREALKERARRKAQEIEEKMKAEKEKRQQKEEEASLAAAKEKEAVQLIEAAVKTAELPLQTGNANAPEPVSRRLSLQRPPSLKAVPRTESSRPTRRLSTTTPRPIPVPPSPASQTESWRARANPIPTSPQPRLIQSRPSVSSNFISSGPSAAEQVESIADGSKDELEVVDFSDMGKFVGNSDVSESVPESSKEVPSPVAPSSRASRPIASDFFEETTVIESSVSSLKKADFGAWRRKVSQEVTEPPAKLEDSKSHAVDEIKQADSSSSARDRVSPIKNQLPTREEAFSPDAAAFSTKESPNHHDGGQTVHLPHNLSAQRTPRTHAFYKETTMSALDDAMSRIKGVLVTMQTHESPKEVSPSNSSDQDLQPSRTISSNHPPALMPARTNARDRWVPPHLRPRKFEDGDEPQEVFLVTVLQPPMSPPPAGNSVLRLPSVSRRVPLIGKKQLHGFLRPPFQARMDILSLDPPVPEMSRRDLSLNDVLFRKPNFYKGKINYRVVLPRRRGPKVNIPSVAPTKTNGVGAFGRPTNADGAATWRNPVTPSPSKVDFAAELDTTSRSPPPDSTPPGTHVASIPKSNENSPTKSESNSAVRPRAQPKMPAGSAVAFRRDSRIIEADATPMVNFIVGSQLDDVTDPRVSSTPTSQPPREEKVVSVAPVTNGVVKLASSSAEDRAPSFAPSKLKKSDSSNEHIPATPPTHHSAGSWSRSSVSLPMKDSPARAPDPEHLKAVWSQTSHKAGLHPVNSLEGIADDLTALPFTLQDVKSEDGETPPPPLPSAPSRMSLHDVTRAFQTVPTSSSGSSQPQHRATFSPPSTHAPVARPTTATYPYPPVPQNSMRPAAYVPYPSPMMSHSPAPVMYGHPMTSSPVPSRMQLNGHTPLYSQPMWMTVPPSSQPHSNMMRPVAPYPAQMMPYPAPGYGPQPPPPNMMPATPQAQNAGRGRGIPVMSPVMSHAHAHPGSAMYSSSPVMLHAVQVPQNHGYMPIPAGRGQPRADNGQIPVPPPPPPPPPQQQQQLAAHNGHHQPSHNGFNPAPTQPFVRPTW